MRRLLPLLAAALFVGAAPAHARPATLVIATTPGQEYAPPTLVVPQGTSLQYVQLDPSFQHDIVSVYYVNRKPMFSTKHTLSFGQTLAVDGVEKLKPATYPFTCSVHRWMTGELIVR